MSYDIYIGEASIESFGDEYNELSVHVRGHSLLEAPTFRGDAMTGNGNSRHPSYSGWSEFLDKVGLHNLFFNKESGLMREHPGCFELKTKDLYVIHLALENYIKNNPTAKPGWCLCDKCVEEGTFRADGLPHEELDGTLARLMWLDFWVTWAIKNCKTPAIANQ